MTRRGEPLAANLRIANRGRRTANRESRTANQNEKLSEMSTFRVFNTLCGFRKNGEVIVPM